MKEGNVKPRKIHLSDYHWNLLLKKVEDSKFEGKGKVEKYLRKIIEENTISVPSNCTVQIKFD